MKFKRNIVLGVFALLFCFTTKSFAQTDTSNFEKVKSRKELRKLRPAYIGIGIGRNSFKIRDFATSPLFYEGGLNQIVLSKLRSDKARESVLSLSYDYGSLITKFNSGLTQSSIKKLEINYLQLYIINKLSTPTFNTKIGFQINVNGNLRINESFYNNGVGLESFMNGLGVIKITKDISTKKEKEKKVGFIKFKIKESKRDISFLLNFGLVNSSFRNGYAYSGQSAILNNTKVFDDYQFKLFSGFRLGTRLDYTKYLKNKNAYQLSYIWDVYKTGGNLDKLEIAQHTLRFTLYYNTNNR